MRTFLIIGLSAIALCGCTDNLLHSDFEAPIIITGNCYQPLARQSQILSLGAEDHILLNAEGGLQADNEILSYSGTQWETSAPLCWHESEETACITALHPVYADPTYTEENLYESGALQDVLFVKDNFPARQTIRFRFKHLFSSLTLQLSGALQEDFQKLEVHCPVVVSAVDAKTAQITFDSSKEHTTSVVQPNASGIYSLIVPPAKNMSLTVTVYASDKTYTTQLPTRSFSSNQDYRYKIKATEQQGPGIATAEEWIAFSVLINSSSTLEYNGKTLNDFGETVDGITTYRLLNDIDFKGVDCSALQHVGKNYLNFNDIFDGQGYTISNLPLKTANATTGIFGNIGNTGTVKNLHAKLCNTTITTGTPSAGVIVGSNLGIISNCSVEECNITSTSFLGGIAGYSKGTIINCNVQNSTLQSKNATGGIVGNSNNGTVLNCFSVNNTIKVDSNGFGGGISGASTTAPTTIHNCYTYDITLNKNKSHGFIIGTAKSSTITHCYYPDDAYWEMIGPNSSSNNETSNNASYNSNFISAISGMPVYELLNQWIETEAPTLYPEFTFNRWTDGGDNLPAVFIKEIKSK